MKLLTKANLYYIATTLVIFLMAGITVYISLQDLIYEELDELLLEQKSAFIDDLNELDGFAFISLPKDSSIIVGPQITADKMFQPEFRDTMLYSYREDEVAPFRQIVFPAIYEEEIHVITIRRSLFEILISNLLSNAIYHNIDGGRINILVRDGRLEISNDGPVPEVDPEMYFERFKKGKSDSDSSGLGLSIVQQISQYFGYKTNYTFQEGMHIFQLKY